MIIGSADRPAAMAESPIARISARYDASILPTWASVRRPPWPVCACTTPPKELAAHTTSKAILLIIRRTPNGNDRIGLSELIGRRPRRRRIGNELGSVNHENVIVAPRCQRNLNCPHIPRGGAERCCFLIPVIEITHERNTLRIRCNKNE